MWSVWDKQSKINGFDPNVFLEKHHLLREEPTIYIKTVNGNVAQAEGKSVLAKIYGIDPALPDEEFLAEYERILATPPAEEETDTTTYAELAQVYAEGVNSIE